MQIGDLVRHVVHSGALGIIVEKNYNSQTEAKVLWTNNTWGRKVGTSPELRGDK